MKGQFGLVVVEIIFFIIAIVAGYMFVSMAYSNVNNMVGAISVRQQIETSQILTDLSILSCAYNNVSDVLSIYAGNYGNQYLNQSQTLLFINGQLVNPINVSLVYTVDNTGYWGPNDVIQINSSLSNGGLYYITIAASNGVKVNEEIYVNNTESTCNLV